jgi:hypothetical protein
VTTWCHDRRDGQTLALSLSAFQQWFLTRLLSFLCLALCRAGRRSSLRVSAICLVAVGRLVVLPAQVGHQHPHRLGGRGAGNPADLLLFLPQRSWSFMPLSFFFSNDLLIFFFCFLVQRRARPHRSTFSTAWTRDDQFVGSQPPLLSIKLNFSSSFFFFFFLFFFSFLW